MKQKILIWLLIICMPLCAQFPPLEISADHVLAIPNGTVEVSIRAGSNWHNITSINGTINFDFQILDNVELSFWGLTNPGGTVFSDLGGGFLTFNWESLISIGPYLNQDDVVFMLQFDVIGGEGGGSFIAFTSVPEPMYWENGFEWSGNNFTITHGSVTVGSIEDDIIFRNDFE